MTKKMFRVSDMHLGVKCPWTVPVAFVSRARLERNCRLLLCIRKDAVTNVKKMKWTFFFFERINTSTKRDRSLAFPPHHPPQKPSNVTAVSCLNFRRRVMLRASGCVFLCEDESLREMPGTFQHVLISANSSSEAPQLWWAGGWLSGKEQT